MEMVQLRLNLAGPMSGLLGCEVLVDHRATGGRIRGQGVMYAGALTDGTASFDPDTMPVPVQTTPEETLANLSIEDWWVGVWGAVLGTDANPPTVKHNVRTVAALPNGAEITTQPFTVRHGQTPASFFGTEAKISSAMDSMAFVAVTGFPDRSSRRPGDRHPMAFQVHYSKQPVPGITMLPPCPPVAALPLLAGKINAAFKAARLAQPEVYAARCLTDARLPRPHLGGDGPAVRRGHPVRPAGPPQTARHRARGAVAADRRARQRLPHRCRGRPDRRPNGGAGTLRGGRLRLGAGVARRPLHRSRRGPAVGRERDIPAVQPVGAGAAVPHPQRARRAPAEGGQEQAGDSQRERLRRHRPRTGAGDGATEGGPQRPDAVVRPLPVRAGSGRGPHRVRRRGRR